MPLFELINPSDPYTFHAPTIEVAGFCAGYLSTAFGARCLEGDNEQTPVLLGWNEWIEDRGINAEWAAAHATEIADAFDSFLIGNERRRADVESMLAMLPEEKRTEWRNQRQDRHRSSMNQIGEAAYAAAKKFRRLADAAASEPAGKAE